MSLDCCGWHDPRRSMTYRGPAAFRPWGGASRWRATMRSVSPIPRCSRGGGERAPNSPSFRPSRTNRPTPPLTPSIYRVVIRSSGRAGSPLRQAFAAGLRRAAADGKAGLWRMRRLHGARRVPDRRRRTQPPDDGPAAAVDELCRAAAPSRLSLCDPAREQSARQRRRALSRPRISLRDHCPAKARGRSTAVGDGCGRSRSSVRAGCGGARFSALLSTWSTAAARSASQLSRAGPGSRRRRPAPGRSSNLRSPAGRAPFRCECRNARHAAGIRSPRRRAIRRTGRHRRECKCCRLHRGCHRRRRARSSGPQPRRPRTSPSVRSARPAARTQPSSSPFIGLLPDPLRDARLIRGGRERKAGR